MTVMEMPKLRKVRSGLYEASHHGHRVQVERIDAPYHSEEAGWWTFYLDDDPAAEPHATRAEALRCAIVTIDNAGGETRAPERQPEITTTVDRDTLAAILAELDLKPEPLSFDEQADFILLRLHRAQAI